MQFTYELTQKDFYQAMVALRSPRKKWLFRVAALVVFPVCLLPIVAWLAIPKMRAHTSLTPLLVMIAVELYIFWGVTWWAARTVYSQQPSNRETKTILLDGSGIHLTSNTSVSDVEWSRILFWFEAKTHFLFYSSPVVFDIIPKRAMTPEQVNEFRTLLTENIKLS